MNVRRNGASEFTTISMKVILTCYLISEIWSSAAKRQARFGINKIINCKHQIISGTHQLYVTSDDTYK